MNYFWLSVADNHTGKNLGACIVRGDDMDKAIERATEMKVLPEGCIDVRGVGFDMDDIPDDNPIKALPLCTLLTKAQCETAGVKCFTTND